MLENKGWFEQSLGFPTLVEHPVFKIKRSATLFGSFWSKSSKSFTSSASETPFLFDPEVAGLLVTDVEGLPDPDPTLQVVE